MKKYILLFFGAILFASCNNFENDIFEVSDLEEHESVSKYTVEELSNAVVKVNNHDEIRELLELNGYVNVKGYPQQGYAKGVTFPVGEPTYKFEKLEYESNDTTFIANFSEVVSEIDGLPPNDLRKKFSFETGEIKEVDGVEYILLLTIYLEEATGEYDVSLIVKENIPLENEKLFDHFNVEARYNYINGEPYPEGTKSSENFKLSMFENIVHNTYEELLRVGLIEKN